MNITAITDENTESDQISCDVCDDQQTSQSWFKRKSCMHANCIHDDEVATANKATGTYGGGRRGNDSSLTGIATSTTGSTWVPGKVGEKSHCYPMTNSPNASASNAEVQRRSNTSLASSAMGTTGSTCVPGKVSEKSHCYPMTNSPNASKPTVTTRDESQRMGKEGESGNTGTSWSQSSRRPYMSTVEKEGELHKSESTRRCQQHPVYMEPRGSRRRDQQSNEISTNSK